MSDFDTMLWRPLRSGNEYDALFPVTSCKSTYVGDGDTDFSIDEMEKVIEQYAFQTTKVAPKLQKSSLKATTDSIHDFLFNHFQYLADESNQLLRSPACSWFTRKKGIDCKSYSILASCLLLNLDITHYIRKIKQPGYAPNDYTHVYVVVPKDQDTGNLESGYYVIDGTLKNNIEPAFIGKNDTRMDGLKHYALNGFWNGNNSNPTPPPANNSNTQPVSQGGAGYTINALKDLAKKLDIKQLSFLKSLGCMGWNGKEKSAVTPEQYQANLTKIDEYYVNWQVRFNTAIQSKNFTEVSKLVAEYKANSIVFVIAVQRKINEKWNSCSTARMQGGLKIFTFYRDVVNPLINAYMDEYFNKISGMQTFVGSSAVSKSQYGFDWQDFSTPTTQSVSYPNVTAKNIDIPAFQVPQAVVDNVNTGTPINIDSVLGLIETGATILAAVSPTNPQSGGTYIDGNGIEFNPDGTKTQKAGMGMWVGGALLIAGIAIATTKFKDNQKK